MKRRWLKVKRINPWVVLAFVGLAALAFIGRTQIAEAITVSEQYVFNGRVFFRQTEQHYGTESHSGTESHTGAVTNSGETALDGDITVGSGATFIPTYADVTLTSPAKTINVASKYFIDLNTDANATGVYPVGGALNQRIHVKMHLTGSATVRLDSGTSMTLNGSNLTFTEGTADNFDLECNDADGDGWTLVTQNGGA